MPYIDVRTLETQYTDDAFKSAFTRLFALRELYLGGIRRPDFAVSEDVLAGINLTEDGARLLGDVVLKRTQLSEAEGRFLVFLLMFHEGLFVDVGGSDPCPLAAGLHACIKSGSIRYPWLFDHILYDAAFDLFRDRTPKLDVDQTMQLLNGKPPGVFQVSQLVVGPYGLMSSEEGRLLRPRRDLLLWHCADQTCNAAHVGSLAQPDTKYATAYRTVRDILYAQSPKSQWEQFAEMVITHDSWYDDLSLVTLPWFLGDAFSQSELRTLLRHLSDGVCRVLWKQDPPISELASTIKRTLLTEASALTKAEVLQLLLLLTDREIVGGIDDLVERRTIEVPPLETRAALCYAPLRNWLGGAHCEASTEGVRVVPHGWPRFGLARLKRLVLSVYEKENEKDVLSWHLRGCKGSTLEAQLEHYINKFDPEVVLHNHIFVSPKKVRSSLVHLRAEHLKIPESLGEDRRLVERMLWKLGFPRVRIESPIQTFYGRLEDFRRIGKGECGEPEQWKASVRSAGVNLFVSLEEILDLTLCFTTWLLIGDHFAARHEFSVDSARALVANELSGLVTTTEGPVNFDPNGRNTLFPLINGFMALEMRLQNLVEHADQCARPRVLFPHFVGKTDLEAFPYRHTHFICDLPAPDRAHVAEVIGYTGRAFQQEQVLSVRNRIDHRSEAFPTRENVEMCCDALNKTISGLESVGFVPTVYLPKSIHRDMYDRIRVTSIDYAGRELVWTTSPRLEAILSLPDVENPQIIVKGICIPGADELVRFDLKQESDFTRLWSDYPKRRKPTDADEREAAETVHGAEPLAIGTPARQTTSS
jgi:hypothetical protein